MEEADPNIFNTKAAHIDFKCISRRVCRGTFPLLTEDGAGICIDVVDGFFFTHTHTTFLFKVP